MTDDETPDLLAALRDSFRRPPATSDVMRIEDAESLEKLPDGSAYISDGHGVAEQKINGLWYAAGCSEPFEPDLPGTAIHIPEPRTEGD
ncbi:hypothetical protein PP301_gp078 [Gordonia phage GMA2]|uniref:Uncharacterized protein n=1 Tax=Gordonia phage GMA2 TaxID=1647283 RepID=A0A0K0N6T0_9CAUD|nr:hypothetical protein PP301_gp078 [Gordonia phage GMA2]AKJ72644.1 hypothetical protein GMA2_106 [Gordonia phage GMA2]